MPKRHFIFSDGTDAIESYAQGDMGALETLTDSIIQNRYFPDKNQDWTGAVEIDRPYTNPLASVYDEPD